MSIEHLSEKQIQQYLDDRSRGLDVPQPGHIDGCEQCRNALADYSRLYGALGKQEKPVLSANFVARTMTLIRKLENPAPAINQYMVWFGIAGIVSCVAAIWYFVDVKALLQSITSVSLSRSLVNWSFVDQMRELAGKFGDTLGVLVFAGLLLAAVALVDKLVVRNRPTKAYFVSI